MTFIQTLSSFLTLTAALIVIVQVSRILRRQPELPRPAIIVSCALALITTFDPLTLHSESILANIYNLIQQCCPLYFQLILLVRTSLRFRSEPVTLIQPITAYLVISALASLLNRTTMFIAADIAPVLLNILFSLDIVFLLVGYRVAQSGLSHFTRKLLFGLNNTA